MNIIYDIALVIVVAGLLVFIMGWAYDWGFKSSRNENESLIRENRKLIIKNNLSQENCQRIQNSYSRLIDEMQRMDIDNNRLNAEINKLKKQEVFNDYNLIENQRLKNQETKYKLRIKELEQAHERKDERIKNLEEVVLDLRICVRALKKQLLNEKLSSEEFNTLKKEG